MSVRQLLRPVVIVVSAMLAGQQAPNARQAATVTLSIVGTNDLHGGVIARDGRGGLALLGGYVRNLRAVRAADGGAVLLIDGGDMFQGTLESNLAEGAPVVAAYNALGYTAAAVGNHEFDYGPVGPAATPRWPTDDPRGALKARVAEAKFPVLAANILDATTGRTLDWPNLAPSVIVEAAGIKVGIVGVTTENTLSATIAANTRGLRIAPLLPTVTERATRLRADGATVVILTAHAGGRCTRFDEPGDLSSCGGTSEIIKLARELPPGLVDSIVAGHTHAGMGHIVNGIPITEGYAGGRSFGRTDLVVDRASKRVTARRVFPPRDLCEQEDPVTHACDPAQSGGARVPAQYEGRPVTADAAIAAVLAPAVQRAALLKARPLGVVLETPLRRAPEAGQTESALGNLFTDAMLAGVPGADVAIHNVSGGLRADLPAGPLTYGRLYEVSPFDNLLISVPLTGAQVRRMLTAQLRRQTHVGIAGLRVQASCSSGSLNVSLVRPSGALVRDEERLVVATTDFLATGGDSVFGPVTPPGGFTIQGGAPQAREVVAAMLEKRGGRLNASQLVDISRPRWMYPGRLPVTC